MTHWRAAAQAIQELRARASSMAAQDKDQQLELREAISLALQAGLELEDIRQATKLTDDDLRSLGLVAPTTVQASD